MSGDPVTLLTDVANGIESTAQRLEVDQYWILRQQLRDHATALRELRDHLKAEQQQRQATLSMLDHLIAHVEDHGEDAASDSVYEDLLRVRAAMQAADKVTP